MLPKEERSEERNPLTDLTDDGYQINYGNSWVATIDMSGDTPECKAILTYGQSSVPTSPNSEDQALLYSQSTLRPCLLKKKIYWQTQPW